MPPLISIITVTKNCVSTLRRTLDSVKVIKASDIEYIVIDGQSTDGTLDILGEYRAYVDQLVSEADTGIYNAMNKGAARANGQYVLFLNGDDHLLENGFEEAKKILVDSQPEILSCTSEVIAEDGTPQGVLKPVLSHLRFFNTIPHLSTFVSTFLQRKYAFREQYRIAADYDLFLRMYLARHRFKLSSALVAVHYRGGFSGNVERSLKEIRDIRRDNLSSTTYFMTNAIQTLNRLRKLL